MREERESRGGGGSPASAVVAPHTFPVRGGLRRMLPPNPHAHPRPVSFHPLAVSRRDLGVPSFQRGGGSPLPASHPPSLSLSFLGGPQLGPAGDLPAERAQAQEHRAVSLRELGGGEG